MCDKKLVKQLLDEELQVLGDVQNEQFRERFKRRQDLHQRLHDELGELLERAPEAPTIEEKMILSSAIVVRVKLQSTVSLLFTSGLPPRKCAAIIPEAEKVEELEAAVRILALWL